MFQFGRFPTYTYVFSIRSMVLHHGGCPIRKSADIMLICSSPQLIAACHVLLRLLMPRHSPCALFRLNFPISFSWNCLSFLNKYLVVVKRFPFCTISPSVKLYLTHFGKTTTNLLKLIIVLYICSFLLFPLLYSVFNEHWSFSLRENLR